MFNWLRNMFKRDKENSFDFYKPKERKLYKYWDGQKIVEEDPMILWKRMMEVRPELITSIKLSQSIHKDAVLGHNDMVSYMRKIFFVKPYGEGGLTESELSNLFDHFMSFCWTVKKKVNTYATSATETSPSTESSSVESHPTEKPLGFGSTEKEPNREEPTQLQSESR